MHPATVSLDVPSVHGAVQPMKYIYGRPQAKIKFTTCSKPRRTVEDNVEPGSKTVALFRNLLVDLRTRRQLDKSSTRITYDWDVCIKVCTDTEIGAVGEIEYIRLIQGWRFCQSTIFQEERTS
jgi:hypothetical protein